MMHWLQRHTSRPQRCATAPPDQVVPIERLFYHPLHADPADWPPAAEASLPVGWRVNQPGPRAGRVVAGLGAAWTACRGSECCTHRGSRSGSRARLEGPSAQRARGARGHERALEGPRAQIDHGLLLLDCRRAPASP